MTINTLYSSASQAITSFSFLNSVRHLYPYPFHCRYHPSRYLLFATQRVLIIMVVNKLSSKSLAVMQYPSKASFQVSSLFTASILHNSLRRPYNFRSTLCLHEVVLFLFQARFLLRRSSIHCSF